MASKKQKKKKEDITRPKDIQHKGDTRVYKKKKDLKLQQN